MKGLLSSIEVEKKTPIIRYGGLATEMLDVHFLRLLSTIPMALLCDVLLDLETALYLVRMIIGELDTWTEESSRAFRNVNDEAFAEFESLIDTVGEECKIRSSGKLWIHRDRGGRWLV